MKTELAQYRKEELLRILTIMQTIRAFEEKAGMMYGLRKIGGFCHLYTGQEAVAAGAISSLDLSKDYVVTAYRDHGHAIACGMDPKKAMAELFGKVTGCSHGKAVRCTFSTSNTIFWAVTALWERRYRSRRASHSHSSTKARVA